MPEVQMTIEEAEMERLVALATSGFDANGRCRSCGGTGQHDHHMPCHECDGTGTMPELVNTRAEVERLTRALTEQEKRTARLAKDFNNAREIAKNASRSYQSVVDARDASYADAARFCGDNERILKAMGCETVEECLTRISAMKKASDE